MSKSVAIILDAEAIGRKGGEQKMNLQISMFRKGCYHASVYAHR